jgi:hypothetical protein
MKRACLARRAIGAVVAQDLLLGAVADDLRPLLCAVGELVYPRLDVVRLRSADDRLRLGRAPPAPKSVT